MIRYYLQGGKQASKQEQVMLLLQVAAGDDEQLGAKAASMLAQAMTSDLEVAGMVQTVLKKGAKDPAVLKIMKRLQAAMQTPKQRLGGALDYIHKLKCGGKKKKK